MLGLNQLIHYIIIIIIIHLGQVVTLITVWVTHKSTSCHIFTTVAPQAKWIKLVHSEFTHLCYKCSFKGQRKVRGKISGEMTP